MFRRLEIDYVAETDSSWALLRFRQEGLRGFVLPMAYLPEFVEALEYGGSDEFYFWMNYGVRHTATSTTLRVSTDDQPLLQIDRRQCAKLVAHLRQTYASELQ